MFRWKLMIQTVFGSRRVQPKAHQPKKTVQLSLERLEDRTVPSAANPLGEAVAAATPYLDSSLSQEVQLLATEQQDLLNEI